MIMVWFINGCVAGVWGQILIKIFGLKRGHQNNAGE
jgi:hypothetical protein